MTKSPGSSSSSGTTEPTPRRYRWPPHRILVGYEELDRSEAAWKVGLEMAREHRADLWLLHVVQLPHEASVRMNPSQKAEMINANLRRFEPLVEEGASLGVAVSLLVMLGDPVELLPRKCQELGADLLLLGTLQRGPLLSWLEGEVSSRVAPKVHMPILLVASHLPPPLIEK